MLFKCNFIVFKLKRNLISILFLLFTISILIFSNSNLVAVKSGINLWATSVVPSLFTFFVATKVLIHTNIVYYIGNLLNRFMKPLFNIRGEGAFAFIMGIISGYPIGAKIATNFRKENICTKEECERLLSFTNNSGPLFIIGSVGILLYRNTMIGFLLFITHLLASLSVGIIFRFWKKNKSSVNYSSSSKSYGNKKTQASLSNLGEILSESIISSIKSILVIGGFVVIFSSIISILKSSGITHIIEIIVTPLFQFIHVSPSFIEPLFTGFFEITNGISTISNIACKKLSINLLITAFLLGFGGISVLLQVLSITSKSDLSIKPYIYGKLLHGIIAVLYTFIFINIFPFFNFDL